METKSPSTVITCNLSISDLDLIETALNQMERRDQNYRDKIRETIATVQVQRSFGGKRIRM